ncbi:MAG: diacylglycerol kinase family lipid kinase [SAR202 cluster bacterium]|jgi:YegS/Rv2252/BmrU family lipid kinase|nr:diacylglycerol kinase family lipid kinase [SAR202 cluster bacterium]
MKEKFAIITNPVAGHGQGEQRAFALRTHLEKRGSEVVIYKTSIRGEGRFWTGKALETGATGIIACGGDGTVHEVINGIKASKSNCEEPVLTILPTGRCNNFAGSLKIPKDPFLIGDLLLNGFSKRVDLGRIGDTYFATVAALGLDSAVAEYVDEGGPPTFLKGTMSYLYGLMAILPKFRFPSVTLTGNYGFFQGPVVLVAAANTDSYGGGFQIAPGAIQSDGLLDICVVRKIPKLQLLTILPRVFSGQHIHHESVSLRATDEMTIESEDTLWIWADGERIAATPATITIEASAIQIKVPKI